MSELSAQVIPWLCCYALATVVSLAALFLKAKVFRKQILLRRAQFVLDEEEETDRATKLRKHIMRSSHNHRTATAQLVLPVHSRCKAIF